MRRRERAGWRAVVRAALGEAAASGPCFDALFDHYAQAQAWSVLPGALEVLDAARERGIRLAIVSNMDARLLAVLEGLQIARRIDALALPSTCGLAKPDPAVFGWALERLERAAAQALYIGDRRKDCVDAAIAAGLHGLRIGPPAAHPQLPGREPPSARSWGEIGQRLT